MYLQYMFCGVIAEFSLSALGESTISAGTNVCLKREDNMGFSTRWDTILLDARFPCGALSKEYRNARQMSCHRYQWYYLNNTEINAP